MLRRALALSFVLVAVLASAALAGRSTLRRQVLIETNWETIDAAPEPLRLTDPTGDIYHPAGTPGYTEGNIDITSVEVSAWAVRLSDLLTEGLPTHPFGDRPAGFVSDVRIGGPAETEDWNFSIGSPYVIAEFELALDITYDDAFYCEYPVAWWNPLHEPFQGIDGDLFNGTNYVTVARTGIGVPNGFDVISHEYMGGQWMQVDPLGFAAAADNRVAYAIPADHLGPAGDALRFRSLQFARGGGIDEGPIGFNFGAFCSEGGQSFDPDLGGVDILTSPVDLSVIPIEVVGPVATTTDTTEVPPATSTPTTLDDTPVTSVVDDEGPTDSGGGGMNPLLIGLIVGGIGGAVLAGTRMLREKADDDTKRPPGVSVRFELDSGISGGFSEVSGIGFEPDAIDYRDGAETIHSTKQPGLSKYANITMKGGSLGGGEGLYEAFRDGLDVGRGSVSLLSDAGPAAKWSFDRAWPTKWSGPGFNAANNEMAFESLELTVENPQFEVGP